MTLLPDPQTWAITCYLVVPAYRRQGVTGQMLGMILADLKQKGAQKVEAFPKRGTDLDALDLWNGPEKIFVSAGFEFVKEVAQRAVVRIGL